MSGQEDGKDLDRSRLECYRKTLQKWDPKQLHSRFLYCFQRDPQNLESSGDEILDLFLKRLSLGCNEWKERSDWWSKLQDMLPEPQAGDHDDDDCGEADLRLLRQFVKDNFSESPDKAWSRIDRWLNIVDYLGSVERRNEPIRRTIEKRLKSLPKYPVSFVHGAFAKLVGRAVAHYEELNRQWNQYIRFARELVCEIAVPVVGFDERFLGVLNLHRHRSSEAGSPEGDKPFFTQDHVALAHSAADHLAERCVRVQMQQLEAFQNVTQQIATGKSFQEVASYISLNSCTIESTRNSNPVNLWATFEAGRIQNP